jgi:hypothetical protein
VVSDILFLDPHMGITQGNFINALQFINALLASMECLRQRFNWSSVKRYCLLMPIASLLGML